MQTIQAGRLDPLPITAYKVVSRSWEGPRISDLEQCPLHRGYWPSLEVRTANYLNFLSGGGDTDKTLPLFCPCLLITVHSITNT